MRLKFDEGATSLGFLTRFDRYLARLIALPLLGTLVIAAMLLLLDKMLRLFDFVVTEGGPASVVWKMLANLLPEYLSLGIPIGIMLGILLAFRRLALSSELDALRSVGLSYTRMLRVPYLYATAAALINLGLVGYVQPLARYAYENLRFDLRSGALGASIKVGEFTQLGRRTTVRVESSRNRGQDLSGIFLETDSPDGRSLAVTAAGGSFLATDDPDTILLRLRNGTLVHDEQGFVAPRVLSFTEYTLPIELPRIESFRGRSGEIEMTLNELVRTLADPRTPERLRLECLSNLQRRLVQVAAMFVLPLLAVSLAVPPKRSTSALGVFLSIVMIVTYHKISQYAERMGGIGRIDPVLGQWVPFVLFSALCGWMFYVLAYRPGGQPIGALDWVAGRVMAAVRSLFPGRRLSEQTPAAG
jgi:lipopolysaccharide export system permease protein